MPLVTPNRARTAEFICASLIQIKSARRQWASAAARGISIRRIPMMDAVMMAIVFVFFALSIAYCYACDWL
jgi:hypothetical protein